MLYESYIHPLTILSTLPSAGVGALLALRLFDTPFSLIALIGIMLLIGIVYTPLLWWILRLRLNEGKLSAQEAIIQASLLRFRPIINYLSRALWRFTSDAK